MRPDLADCPEDRPSLNSFMVLHTIERARSCTRAAAARDAPISTAKTMPARARSTWYSDRSRSCPSSSTRLASPDTMLDTTTLLGGGCSNSSMQVRRRVFDPDHVFSDLIIRAVV